MTAAFTTLDSFRDLLAGAAGPDAAARDGATTRNGELTKPPGALGRLEDLAIWVAGWQGTPRPVIASPQIIVFAGNHGICAQGVSAFPAEVTAQMVGNFSAGGAAINQLARSVGASMSVVPLALNTPTQDFTTAAAMSEDDVVAALLAGWDAVDAGSDLLVVGEMGIGNTTVAAALAAALLGGDPADWVGRGTGVDDAGIARKIAVVRDGLTQHADVLSDPLQVLRCLGGRELAGMAGAIARARVTGIPVILDGFICTAAALVLDRAVSGALDHAVAGHVSAEGAHRRMLAALDKAPLLDLGLRLGEGSGGALAINIVQAAVACHSGMSTFEEAAVAGKSA